MTPFSENLVTFCPMLLIGSTVLLGIGCLAIRLTRSPVHRQRLGETTVASVLVWMVLAVLPLPRLLPQSIWMRDTDVARNIRSTSNAEIELSLPVTHTNRTTNDASVASFAIDADRPTHADSWPFDAHGDHLKSIVQSNEDRPVDRLNLATERTLGQPFVLNVWNQCGPIGATLYLIGALGCCTWLAFGHLLLIGIRMRGRDPEPWLRELFESLMTKDAPARTRLLISTACRRPISWGAIWPVVVLPTDLCRRSNEGHLRIILLHELGHVTQGDAWGNLLLTMAFPLLFVQPLYWWLKFQVRLAAELVADECAARQIGKEFYASELIALARTATSGSNFWGVTGVVSSPSLFYRRMEMLIARETPLVNRPSPSWRLASLTAAGLTVVLAAVLFGMHSAEGQQEPRGSSNSLLDIGDEAAAEIELSKSESQDQSPGPELPLAKNIASTGDKPRDTSSPAADLPKPKPGSPLGLDRKPQDPLILDAAAGPERSDGAKDAKYDRVLIRSTDDGEIELVFESDQGKTRMIAKRFLMVGRQIKAGDVAAIDMSRKNGDSYRKQVTNSVTSKIEAKSAVKLQGAENDPVHECRVVNNDEDGSLSLEIWRIVDGKSPNLISRFQLSPGISSLASKIEGKLSGDEQELERRLKIYGPEHPQILELQARIQQTKGKLEERSLSHPPRVAMPEAGPLTEFQKRERVPIYDRDTGSATNPAPRSAVESAASNRIDLIALATTYADALSAVESASDPVMQQRAERKANLLRRMINLESRGINEECARMEKLYKSGAVSFRDLADSKSRRAMLEEILELDQGSRPAPASLKAAKSAVGTGSKAQPRQGETTESPEQ